MTWRWDKSRGGDSRDDGCKPWRLEGKWEEQGSLVGLLLALVIPGALRAVVVCPAGMCWCQEFIIDLGLEKVMRY